MRRPPASPAQTPRLVQKNKSFEPHILVIPAGSMVEFPNHDPFFHNVFSLFEGKRFDLGLYEAGTSRMVRFDRPGISYIFCNIHPEMSAVIITLPRVVCHFQCGRATQPDGRSLWALQLARLERGHGSGKPAAMRARLRLPRMLHRLGVIRVPAKGAAHGA
jgi:hypothetical protein